MSKFNVQKLNKREKDEIQNKLFEAVKQLRSKQDIVDFFRDLLTDSESVMLARRLIIARLILEDKSFYEIREETDASYDTINTIKKLVDYGNKGYKKVIERLDS